MRIGVIITLFLGLLASRQAVGHEVDPALIEMRVGLQCDAAANRAFVRLGGLDVGMPGQFADLPPEASRSTARIVEAHLWQDAVCRLRDGAEIRLRVFRSDGSRCRDHYVSLWVGARRILTRVAIGRCAEDWMRHDHWFQKEKPAGHLGWVVSATRVDVCLHTGFGMPGPDPQCRIVGDPRLMGVRDWMEYPLDGRRPRLGQIYIQYAADRRFCESFIKRGLSGMPDVLAVPRHFERPVFEGDHATFDLDNDGSVDAVRWQRVWAFGTYYSHIGIGPVENVAAVREVFFHRGLTHLLLARWPGDDLPGIAIDEIREGPTGKAACRFRQVGDDAGR